MKISILSPSFNSAKYLERAISSVMQQSYPHWEHLVVDGGSTDGSIAILRRYQHIIWYSEKDHGQSDAMNKAFQRASGDIIIYLNADDELEPGALTNFASVFQRVKDADIVVSDLRINNCGKVFFRTPAVSLSSILDYTKSTFPSNPVSYAYRRSLQEKIGAFPLSNHLSMDYWFLLRAYLFGKVVQGDFIGGTFYLDGGNKSSDFTKSKASLHQVRKAFLREYFYKPEVLTYLLKRIKKRVAG